MDADDDIEDPREVGALMLAVSFLRAGLRGDAAEQKVIIDTAGYRDLLSGHGHVFGLTAKLAVAAMTGRPFGEIGNEDLDNILALLQQGHLEQEAGGNGG